MLQWSERCDNALVRGSVFDEEETSALLWHYVQGFDAQGLIEVYEENSHEGDVPPPLETVSALYSDLDRYLFKKLIEAQMPKEPDVRAMFPENEDQYLESLAAHILVD